MSAHGTLMRKRHKMPDNAAVIATRNAAHLVGKQRLDYRPLKVRKIKAAFANSFRSLNHKPPSNEILFVRA